MQKRISAFSSTVLLPAREIIRAPITLLLTVTAVAGTLCIPLVLAFQFGDTGQRLARDGGLGMQLTMGTLLAAASACSLIRRERESGVAAMLLTKPVSRRWYLLSRFMGIASILALFTVVMATATLLAHRAAEGFHPETGYHPDHIAALSGLACIPLAAATAAWRNWKAKSSFHAVALLSLPIYLLAACLLAGFYTRGGRITLSYAPDMDPRIIVASLSLMLALFIFAAFALTLSTILPPVSTAIVCLLVLFLGFSTPLLMTTTNQLRIGFAILPNLNWFWLTEAIDTESKLLSVHFLLASLYGILLLIPTLTLGIWLMENVEVPS